MIHLVSISPDRGISIQIEMIYEETQGQRRIEKKVNVINFNHIRRKQRQRDRERQRESEKEKQRDIERERQWDITVRLD